ncbi:MAG: hypothetical protein V7K98_23910 [Nostoc sp.]|uniref:hypothetical protein n=1 Tax=Nostoc sp. TaxID=1180 RepID=UPI002FFA59ED
MARKVKQNEWMVGLYVHYWGVNYRVWSIDGNEVLLVVPGEKPNIWYQPYPGELQKFSSVTVSKNDEFVMIFDTKRKLAGR